MKRYLHLNPFMLTISGTPFLECKRIIMMRNKRKINIYLQINNFIKESNKLFVVICKSELV